MPEGDCGCKHNLNSQTAPKKKEPKNPGVQWM